MSDTYDPKFEYPGPGALEPGDWTADVIRYLRGLVENLESGKAVLVEYSQERERDIYTADGITVDIIPTGGRKEFIRWKEKQMEIEAQVDEYDPE